MARLGWNVSGIDISDEGVHSTGSGLFFAKIRSDLPIGTAQSHHRLCAYRPQKWTLIRRLPLFSADLQCLGEGCVPRRAAHVDAILAWHEFPRIFRHIEDRQKLPVQRQGDWLRLAGRQHHLTPSYETLGRLARIAWQRCVYLCDLRPGSFAGIAHVEDHLDFVPRHSLQPGVGEGSVREAEPEWEERLLILRVEPLVADLESFGVIDVERRRPPASGSCVGRLHWRRPGSGDEADRPRSWER